MRAVCSGTGGIGGCGWSDMAKPPAITAPTPLSTLRLTHSPTVSGSKWDSLLHAFWSCLLVEHEQPVSHLRARRGGSKQSWLRRDQLAEALEEIKSVEPDADGGRTRIKAHRSRCRFRQLAIKLPGLLGDESWNRTVLWHRADKLLLRPVPEQVVGGHRRPPPVCLSGRPRSGSCHTCAGR